MSETLDIINEIISTATTEIAERTGVSVRLSCIFQKNGQHHAGQLDELLFEACGLWGEQVGTLRSAYRGRNIVAMRNALWMVIKQRFPSATYRQLANLLGRTNHATVIRAIQNAKGLLLVKDDLFIKYYNPIKHLSHA